MKLKYNQTDEDFAKKIHPPEYAHPHDSGMDIFCPADVMIQAYDRITITTGIHFEIKLPLIYKMLNLFGASIGIELQVRPKSGRSKNGVDVEIGTVDQTYRGYVGVTITNTNKTAILIRKNEKICQIVACPVFNKVKLYRGIVSTNTKRGTGGFGSSGLTK